MSLLNRYVEIKSKSTAGTSTAYGYVVEETDSFCKVTLGSTTLDVGNENKSIRLKLIDHPSACDKYTKHEALHATNIVMTMMQDHLLNHWYAIADPEYYKLVEEAQSKLMEAYQLLGAIEV